MKRTELVAVARTLVGTPFQHQGTVKGVGMDCRGMLMHIARAFGREPIDCPGYSNQPNALIMYEYLKKNLDEIKVADAKIGDILWLAFAEDPMHLVMLTPAGIIHATSAIKPPRVVEHGFVPPWTRRPRSAFEFPGVED